jgi:hypothetical protein
MASQGGRWVSHNVLCCSFPSSCRPWPDSNNNVVVNAGPCSPKPRQTGRTMHIDQSPGRETCRLVIHAEIGVQSDT